MKNWPKRVLIVEDNPLLAMELIELVEEIGGVTALCTSNIRGAKRFLTEHRVDVALLNIQMEEGNTFAVADELKRLGIPWIFISGYVEDVLEGRYADVPFVSKPFAHDQLAVLVQNMLQGTLPGLTAASANAAVRRSGPYR